MGKADDTERAMKWKELDGEERYRVVELARKGEVPLSEICETFGVSRQTLYRAMEKAEQASMAALEPKSAGRKGKSEQEVRLEAAQARTTELEKELGHWKMKYDVAKTYLDLIRRAERGEDLDEEDGPSQPSRKKKGRRKKRAKPRKRKRVRPSSTKLPSTTGSQARVESSSDGRGDADER
jgi:transposase-like protein